jgi:hypothetical protein
MHTISSPKKTPGNSKTSEEVRENVHPHPDEMNITDGGEFLDDGIRMKEQPFGESNKKKDEPAANGHNKKPL